MNFEDGLFSRGPIWCDKLLIMSLVTCFAPWRPCYQSIFELSYLTESLQKGKKCMRPWHLLPREAGLSKQIGFFDKDDDKDVDGAQGVQTFESTSAKKRAIQFAKQHQKNKGFFSDNSPFKLCLWHWKIGHKWLFSKRKLRKMANYSSVRFQEQKKWNLWRSILAFNTTILWQKVNACNHILWKNHD